MGIFRGSVSLGIFRRQLPQNIPRDVGPQNIPTDTLPRNIQTAKVSRNIPTAEVRRNIPIPLFSQNVSEDRSIGKLRGDTTNSPRKCFFGMSLESLILSIPSEFLDEILRKFYFPTRIFRRQFSLVCPWNTVIPRTYRRYLSSESRCFLVVNWNYLVIPIVE